jgi:hypothetical protein
MFRTVPLSIIRSYSLYTQQWYMSYRQLSSSSRIRMELQFHPDPGRKLSTSLYDVPLLCVQWITPDDGQRYCPKHVEFYLQNKFWEISASDWFYYNEICHDVRSHECKIWLLFHRREGNSSWERISRFLMIFVQPKISLPHSLQTGPYFDTDH